MDYGENQTVLPAEDFSTGAGRSGELRYRKRQAGRYVLGKAIPAATPVSNEKIILSVTIAGMLVPTVVLARAVEMPMLVLNDTNGPPFTTPDDRVFLDAVAGEAFRRAGVQLSLAKPPAR